MRNVTIMDFTGEAFTVRIFTIWVAYSGTLQLGSCTSRHTSITQNYNDFFEDARVFKNIYECNWCNVVCIFYDPQWRK